MVSAYNQQRRCKDAYRLRLKDYHCGHTTYTYTHNNNKVLFEFKFTRLSYIQSRKKIWHSEFMIVILMENWMEFSFRNLVLPLLSNDFCSISNVLFSRKKKLWAQAWSNDWNQSHKRFWIHSADLYQCPRHLVCIAIIPIEWLYSVIYVYAHLALIRFFHFVLTFHSWFSCFAVRMHVNID